MIRKRYENQLNQITQNILKMGLQVEDMFQRAITNLKELNTTQLSSIINEGLEINQMEISIEDECIMLIAKEQPVAKDLRKLICALKTVTQLERMGDHAAHIAKVLKQNANNLKERLHNEAFLKIHQMGELALKNFTKILEAYATEDVKLCYTLAQEDDKIDTLYDEIMKALAHDLSHKSQATQLYLDLIYITRCIERFGDHSLNILEWIIYNKEGRHVEF